MLDSVIVGEWYDIDRRKPPRNRILNCYLNDGTYAHCKWNGFYFVGQHGMRLMGARDVLYWQMFELVNENDMI